MQFLSTLKTLLQILTSTNTLHIELQSHMQTVDLGELQKPCTEAHFVDAAI
jgi:hypothetical protein